MTLTEQITKLEAQLEQLSAADESTWLAYSKAGREHREMCDKLHAENVAPLDAQWTAAYRAKGACVDKIAALTELAKEISETTNQKEV